MIDLIYQVPGLGHAGRANGGNIKRKDNLASSSLKKKSENCVEIIEWLTAVIMKESGMKDLVQIIGKKELRLLLIFSSAMLLILIKNAEKAHLMV